MSSALGGGDVAIAARYSHLNLTAREKLVDAVFAGMRSVTSAIHTEPYRPRTTSVHGPTNHEGLHGMARHDMQRALVQRRGRVVVQDPLRDSFSIALREDVANASVCAKQ